MPLRYTVFSKPWKMPIGELAEHVRALGFDGVELPVRPGYPVTPDNAPAELPRAARQFAEQGLKIASIAGPTDEATIAACAEARVPVIRICVDIHRNETYTEGEARLQREFDGIVPHLDRYGVTLGIQNHCDRCVANAAGVRTLIAKYDPKHVAAVWDAAHEALNGQDPELALDIVWPHLCMVNLKNAFWLRTNGPEAEQASWRHYWTSGKQGLASWPRVAAELRRRSYDGVVCLTAEYSDETAVDRLAADDLAYAKELLSE